MVVATYLEHPSDEALEQFVMNKLGDGELEYVETHILACEACVCKLELLEEQLAAMQIALQEFQAEQVQKQHAARRSPSWKNWFAVPNLSWAAAAAVLALAVMIGPRYVPSSVQVGAERGDQTVVVPDNRPLHVTLKAVDVPEGMTRIEVVSETGSPIWSGTTTVHQGVADLSMPRLKEAGVYFIRLYSASVSSTDPVREFRVEAK